MTEITLTLNTFDEDGNVDGQRDVKLSIAAITDIIDHAAQYTLLRRAGFNRSEVDTPTEEEDRVAEELDEALTAASVIIVED